MMAAHGTSFMSYNPYGKKNPFLSLWLSGANAMLGAYRNEAQAAMRRQSSAAISQGTRHWLALWGLDPPKRSRRSRRR
jgi:hypothetical protein